LLRCGVGALGKTRSREAGEGDKSWQAHPPL
jgi:hypothetical protein